MSHRMMQLMVGCLCFGVLLILINIYQLRSINAGQTVGDPEFGSSRRPVVWVNAKNVRNFKLRKLIILIEVNSYYETIDISYMCEIC